MHSCDYSPELPLVSGGIFAYSLLLAALSCCFCVVAVVVDLLFFLKPNDIDPFVAEVLVVADDAAVAVIGRCTAKTCFPFFLLSDCP